MNISIVALKLLAYAELGLNYTVPDAVAFSSCIMSDRSVTMKGAKSSSVNTK
jgi:hypothetical protein